MFVSPVAIAADKPEMSVVSNEVINLSISAKVSNASVESNNNASILDLSVAIRPLNVESPASA